MADVLESDGRYCISYVTGPSHVYLCLGFGEAPVADVPVTMKTGNSACGCGDIDIESMKAAVQEAVARELADSGMDLHLSEILYLETDSPRYDLYGLCARKIAEHVVKNRLRGD